MYCTCTLRKISLRLVLYAFQLLLINDELLLKSLDVYALERMVNYKFLRV